MTDKPLAYWAAARLIEKSDYHRDWDDEEINRCIIPPIEEDLYILGYNEYNNIPILSEPQIFATYAFPEVEHIEEYIDTGAFPKAGFYGNGNTPWLIDFICISGMRDIIGSFRYLKAMFNELGYDNAQWLRTARDKRGWHNWKG